MSFQAGHIPSWRGSCEWYALRPGRVGPARARGKLTWSVAPSPRASGGTRCTRPVWTSVRRRIRRLIGVAHRLSLGSCRARGCWWPRWRRLSRATGGSFRRKCAALLTGSGSGVRFRSEQGKLLNPGGFSGFSRSSARAAGRLRPEGDSGHTLFWARRPSAGLRLEATASNDQRRLDAAL